jgi:serine/threonine-protein kinase PknG
VLLTDVHGFSKEHLYTLPGATEEPVFAGQESLYRFLLKATAPNADDRFETAEEMAEQLLGVLREVVAVESGSPRPAPSLFFGTDLLALDAADEMESIHPDYRHLPLRSLDVEDPGAQAVNNANALTDRNQRVAALRLACKQVPKSRETRLRLAANLSDVGEYAEAGAILKALGDEDPWDWRVL